MVHSCLVVMSERVDGERGEINVYTLLANNLSIWTKRFRVKHATEKANTIYQNHDRVSALPQYWQVKRRDV